MKKKMKLSILSGVLAVGVLAGCGTDNDNGLIEDDMMDNNDPGMEQDNNFGNNNVDNDFGNNDYDNDDYGNDDVNNDYDNNNDNNM